MAAALNMVSRTGAGYYELTRSKALSQNLQLNAWLGEIAIGIPCDKGLHDASLVTTTEVDSVQGFQQVVEALATIGG